MDIPSRARPSTHLEPSVRSRFAAVDALRGVAIVWMTAFHFCFDLNYFGYWRQNFYADPLWTWQRTAIVSLFLFCAGLGQAIGTRQAQSWQRFWRRWAQVAGCALLVTAGSYWMFPKSFIYFGVLHGIAVMLIVVRLLAPWGRRHPIFLCLLGALAIAAKFIAAYVMAATALSPFAEIFNGRALNWLGLITRLPITEDYVPIFPWLGVMLWGLACGQWLLARRPRRLAMAVPPRATWLAWMGRHSLPWYMLHQLVLLGALALIGWTRA